jgi:hypothetical protein
MATRMQQRRGTAEQWTDADPILAAGEIGFETDTNQFKIGDGVNNWSDLSYFKNLEDLGGSLDDYVPVTTKGQVNGVAELDSTGNVPLSQLGNLIDGAPEALNTLNELAASINDDTNFVAYVTTQLSNKANLASPSLTGVPLAPTAILTDNSTKIATTAFVKGQAYGLASDISNLDIRLTDSENDIDSLQTTSATLVTNVGQAQTDISTLEATTISQAGRISDVESDVVTLQSSAATGASDITALETLTASHTGSITSLESDVTEAKTDITALESTSATLVSDVSGLETLTTSHSGSIATLESDVTTAKSDIDTLQGDLDTAEATLATTTSNFNSHDAKTTTVHGIADTAALATKTYADTAGTNAIASANTYADSVVASKAPLASPALTGTPTAPTASAGTNTTQIATTAFVKSEVDAVIAAAPGALNTLDELAAALGDDANFASTVTTNLASKAPLASPTFTGTVALPAASSVTLNGTALSATLATKADKTAAISSKSGAYTIASADVNSIIEFNSGSGASFTIPSDNSFWPDGQRLEVLQVSGGQVTIAGAAGVTVNGTPTTKTRTTWSGATIIKRAANTFVVVGDLASS